MDYLRVELAEYWKAVEKGANVPNFNETTAKATELSDEDFNALYGEKIHNTTTDELADTKRNCSRYEYIPLLCFEN